ncbi:hypothetical protein LXL04_015437 [Taraxacum kok-saghyz]
MSNLSRNRVRKDRFYSPPAMRRYNQQQQEQEQQQRQQEQQVERPKHQAKKDQLESPLSRCSSSIPMTNLDRFMKHTTPVVTAQHFPKTSMKGWRNDEDDYHPYFNLGDLWESFKEWSAYGVGVPLLLNEKDSVVQYYAPSLSAIQLYIDPTPPTTTIRRLGEDSDYESSRTSSSGESYEPVARGPRAANNVDSVARSFGNKLMLKDGLFEYFEHASPFQRAPLATKASLSFCYLTFVDLETVNGLQISDLESTFPKLNTYRSCDLTQSSWLSVAWYPIYRIPVGPSLQNVDTSFLTYHSLSTPLKSTNGSLTARQVHEGQMPCQLSLPIFGLSVYKLKNSDWTKDGAHGTEKINSLVNSAENWLRSLDVYHPDFEFFRNH